MSSISFRLKTDVLLLCLSTVSLTTTLCRADVLTSPSGTHDPSRMVYAPENQTWYYFYTGNGIPFAKSTDQITWTHTSANRVFPSSGPGADSTNYWAPDMWPTPIHGQYYLFYSLSSFGSQISSIKVASTTSVATPTWTLLGNAIASTTGSAYNTIDPCPYYDAVADRLWITFGSFWKGIYIVELDPSNPTVQLSTPTFLAGGRPGPNAIEGSFVFKHGNFFYLDASTDTCCAGGSSTYKQIIGRSSSITGPYVDRDGVDLRTYGGTIFISGGAGEVGPGQFGLYSQNGQDRFTYHLYSNNNGGASFLGARGIDWDASGWPLAIFPNNLPQGVYNIQRQGTNLYLHVTNDSTDPTVEGHIEQDILIGRPSQNWLFLPTTSPGGDTYYNIKNVGTNLWLTLAAGPGDNRAVPAVQTNGTVASGSDFVRDDFANNLATNENQKWRVILNTDGSFGLQNYRSGLVVGLPTTSLNSFVHAVQKPWAFPNETLERFALDPVTACQTDASAQISVTRGGFRYNNATKQFVQTLSVTNLGSSLSSSNLVLDNMPRNATLATATGSSACVAPALSPSVSLGDLSSGQTVSVVLQFNDPTMAAITYTARVLAGPGIE